jgi:hypothetical protein
MLVHKLTRFDKKGNASEKFYERDLREVEWRLTTPG